MTTANPSYEYGYSKAKKVGKEEKLNTFDKKRLAILKKDRKTTVTALLLIGIILIGAVVMSAYTADLKYQNNELIAANEELQDEIDMLNIEIQTATNLTNIEKIAREKYGMEYADPTDRKSVV